MANFEDFLPIFSLTADFFARGGGAGVRIFVKYSPVEDNKISIEHFLPANVCCFIFLVSIPLD